MLFSEELKLFLIGCLIVSLLIGVGSKKRKVNKTQTRFLTLSQEEQKKLLKNNGFSNIEIEYIFFSGDQEKVARRVSRQAEFRKRSIL